MWWMLGQGGLLFRLGPGTGVHSTARGRLYARDHTHFVHTSVITRHQVSAGVSNRNAYSEHNCSNIHQYPLSTNMAVIRPPEAGARVRISPGAQDKTPCQRRIPGPASAVDYTDSLKHVASKQVADLAELKDFVEGLRQAAHQARSDGNVSLAQALEITRFEIYQAYLDELAAPTARRAKEK